VERRIDLSNLDVDVAAALIVERRPRWLDMGLTAREITWVGNDAGWPKQLLTDRNQARRPMSVGVRVTREKPFAEAQFVLYAGGWADADYAADGYEEVVSEYVELDDAAQLGDVLDRVVAKLLGA
jgi:hypothetical protein